MRSSKKFADVAAVSVAFGTVAVVAALVVGLTGWPLARASAAPHITPGALGIGARSSGPVGIETTSGAKVTLDSTSSAVTALVSAAPKALAPIPVAKKRAKASATHRSAVRRTGTRSARARSTAGLRTARVSWYGPGFYGHTMAGGGTLTPSSMVVAHRSLSFGTRVQINYRGRTCVAVVRDRGPYVSGRTFDLGPGTANALGFSGVGTISYRVL